MRLNFTVDDVNQKIDLSFIPFNFLFLEDLLGSCKVQSVNRLEFSVFEKDCEDLHIDLNNYRDYIGEIRSLKDILNFFSKYSDREIYSIFKLELNFGNFSLFYDDDSLVVIRSNDVKQYDFFHILYLKLYNIYQEENYKLEI